MNNYECDNDVVYSCKYHVVWCPKYRKKVLIGSIQQRLEEIIYSSCEELNVNIIKLMIQADYVYLHVGIVPQMCIHKVVKHIKRNSSRIMRNEFKDLRTKIPTLWTNSYFATTDDELSQNTINAYINIQVASPRKEKLRKKE